MKTDSKGTKQIAIMIGVACLVLSIVLIAALISFATALGNKDKQITSLQTQTEQQQTEIDTLKQQVSSLQNTTTANLTRQIANLTQQIAQKDTQITNLTNQNAILIDQVNSLQAQLDQTLTTQEKVRDQIMDYIKFNHPETTQFMNQLAWTGGRTTPAALIGAETYEYTGNGWKFTINYPVVPNPLYNATADYSAPFTGIPYRIIWKGTWQNWYINETSYVFAQ